MATHALNIQRTSWDASQFPPEISSWTPSSNDPKAASALRVNQGGTAAGPRLTSLNAYAAQAIIAYIKKDGADMALVDTGNGMTCSAEKTLPDMTTIIATVNRPSFQSNTLNLRASLVTLSGAYTPIPPLTRDSTVDLSPVFLCLLAHAIKSYQPVSEDVDLIATHHATTGTFDGAELNFRRVADSLVFALNEKLLDVAVPGSNIDLLAQQSVTMGSLNGTAICGTPNILVGINGVGQTIAKTMTFAEAKAKFSDFAEKHKWSNEERELIPVFPEDYKVPQEAIKIADLYVATRSSRRPMNNFMWRGVTSYGKSSGVELMAAFLGIPLLRMTCSTSMETQDFLSNFVPDNGAQGSVTGDLPSFTEISADPATAYQMLTGIEDDNATCDMCLKAYADAVVARTGDGTARFKHVESNFVKALTRGYIVEIQEISRIKDAGVLVGLNEYDRPGAIIPLVDGSFKRRHPDAMVVYTDNVGYASCRAIDPSVLRRMSIIIDSYDMPREDVLARVLYNTDFPDNSMLDQMYDVWSAIQEYCQEHDISDGTVSVTELEMWALAVKVDNMSNLKDYCRDCVVAKATSDRQEQEAIMADVVDIRLS